MKNAAENLPYLFNALPQYIQDHIVKDVSDLLTKLNPIQPEDSTCISNWRLTSKHLKDPSANPKNLASCFLLNSRDRAIFKHRVKIFHLEEIRYYAKQSKLPMQFLDYDDIQESLQRINFSWKEINAQSLYLSRFIQKMFKAEPYLSLSIFSSQANFRAHHPIWQSLFKSINISGIVLIAIKNQCKSKNADKIIISFIISFLLGSLTLASKKVEESFNKEANYDERFGSTMTCFVILWLLTNAARDFKKMF